MPANSSINILVVQVAGIGDAVMASTIAERLRVERPDAKVSWICGEASAPLVALYDAVGEVITVDQQRLFRGSTAERTRAIVGVWRRIAGRKFDRVILVHVDPRFRILVTPLVGTPKTMLSRVPNGRMIPIPGRYLGDEYSRLVAGPENVGPIERRYDIANLRPKLQPTAPAPRSRKRIILVPGGARNALREDVLRRWPVEHYSVVARQLVAAGCEVVLVGNAADEWVRRAFDRIEVTDRIGALSLVETATLMCDCDLVISHDTGPMHLARIVRAPLLAIFGPTNPSQFIVPDETVTVLWGGAELACRPCYDGRELARCASNVCLSRIAPQKVLACALDRLGIISHDPLSS